MSKETGKCLICNGKFNEYIESLDKMFEKSEIFVYGKCESCGCLQEINPPEKMHEHYPQNYYSLSPPKNRSIKNWRKALKRKIILTHPHFLHKIIKFLIPGNELYWAYRNCGLKINDKLLDIGTGAGEHVIELRQAGLKNATGIDPHIEGDILYEGSTLVKKCDIKTIREKFKFITFHHSLEHIPDQIKTIKMASNLLTDDGKILIRVPTVSSVAYEKYKSDWFQLDAPRHLFLHSHKSIEILAESSGMKISKIWCDSNELQFLISELHSRKINPQLNHQEIKKYIKQNFTSNQINEYKKQTQMANDSMMGDQIAVLLEKN